MFFFGNSQDNASLYWNEAINTSGPGVVDRSANEMSVDELRNFLVYKRMAYTKAKEDGAPSETLDILLQDHDDAFKLLSAKDEWFKGLILGVNPGIHNWLNGFEEVNVKKYKDLALAS